MSIASGLGATLTVVEEGSYGVEPSFAGARGYEFDSHSLKHNKQTKQGSGLRGGGLFPRSNRRAVVAQDGGGDISLDFPTKGAGLFLKHMFGSSSIVQVGSTPAFRQTHVAGDLRTRSLGIQAGVPDITGALQPFTYLGCKVTEWEIGVDNRDLAKLKVSIDSREATTRIGYSAPDYTMATAAKVFSFAGAELFVAGSATPVVGGAKLGLKQSNKLKTDRYHLGAGGRKAEPLNTGWLSTMLTVDSEYIDQVTWVARHFTDETFRVEFRFFGDIISGATREELFLSLPAVKLNSETPSVDGPDVVTHGLELEVLDNGVDSPITCQYVSTDTLL